jgi:hypothetical protein
VLAEEGRKPESIFDLCTASRQLPATSPTRTPRLDLEAREKLLARVA